MDSCSRPTGDTHKQVVGCAGMVGQWGHVPVWEQAEADACRSTQSQAINNTARNSHCQKHYHQRNRNRPCKVGSRRCSHWHVSAATSGSINSHPNRTPLLSLAQPSFNPLTAPHDWECAVPCVHGSTCTRGSTLPWPAGASHHTHMHDCALSPQQHNAVQLRTWRRSPTAQRRPACAAALPRTPRPHRSARTP